MRLPWDVSELITTSEGRILGIMEARGHDFQGLSWDKRKCRHSASHWVCGRAHSFLLTLVLSLSSLASGFFIQLVLLVSSSINWFAGKKASESRQTIINKWSPPARKPCGVRVPSHFSRVRLCHPTDCGPPGSSVRGLLQARILEWAAVRSSTSSQPRDWAPVSYVSCIGKRALYDS